MAIPELHGLGVEAHISHLDEGIWYELCLLENFVLVWAGKEGHLNLLNIVQRGLKGRLVIHVVVEVTEGVFDFVNGRHAIQVYQVRKDHVGGQGHQIIAGP